MAVGSITLNTPNTGAGSVSRNVRAVTLLSPSRTAPTLLPGHLTELDTVPPLQFAAFGGTGAGRALPGHPELTSWYRWETEARDERLAQV